MALIREIHDGRGELLKWMFAFWVGQFFAFGGLLAFMFHARVQPMRNPPADGDAALDATTPPRLTGPVEEIGRTAGVHLWYLAIVGGAAWKMETALARLARRHLPGVLPDGVAVLLSGLPDGTDDPPPHAVTSIDWYRPRLGSAA